MKCVCGYEYEQEKLTLFDDGNMRVMLQLKIQLDKWIRNSGAFVMDKIFATKHWAGERDLWVQTPYTTPNHTFMAMVDFLTELHYYKEVNTNLTGRHRVFIAGSKYIELPKRKE